MIPSAQTLKGTFMIKPLPRALMGWEGILCMLGVLCSATFPFLLFHDMFNHLLTAIRCNTVTGYTLNRPTKLPKLVGLLNFQ